MRTSSRRRKISAVLIGALVLLVPATSAVADAVLTITKAGPAAVVAGANLTYTITVTNGGPDAAESVTLSDTTPPGTTFVSVTPAAGWTCTPPVVPTGPVSCTTSPLAASTSAEFTLVVNVDPGTADGTVITNTATVSWAGTAEPSASATVETTVGLSGVECTYMGTDGPDIFSGTSGDDVICGGNGSDVLMGGEGNDIIIGGNGHDTIDGGPGNDIIIGGNGKDVLVGGEGNDTLMGRNGKDDLTGGLVETNGDAGVDMLLGGNGKDHLNAQDGAPEDSLNGGRGKDDCHFDDPGDLTTSCP